MVDDEQGVMTNPALWKSFYVTVQLESTLRSLKRSMTGRVSPVQQYRAVILGFDCPC